MRALDEKAIEFIACVNDEVLYRECEKHLDALEVPPGYRVHRTKIVGAKSMAGAYDEAMRASDAKYKVYLHQDTFIINTRFIYDMLEVFQHNPRVGMIGVVGGTRLPSSGVWFQNNFLFSVGEVREYRRWGGLSLLWNPRNPRKEGLMLFRKIFRPYIPVVVIDGLIMITQYDLPWRQDLYGGFIYYEGPQCLEFIKNGYEVVVPRQKPTWCMHYGNIKDKTAEEWSRYQEEFRRVMQIFRKEYGEFLQVGAPKLLQRFAHKEKE